MTGGVTTRGGDQGWLLRGVRRSSAVVTAAASSLRA